MSDSPFILSLIVANHFGVLTRVSSLFARRGFNIDSLSVGETEDPETSRMTIVSWGDDYVKDQIVKQLEKLLDVQSVTLMEPEGIVLRELMLVKVTISEDAHPQVLDAINTFRAHIIDMSAQSITAEIINEPQQLNAFVEALRPYGSIEVCRTGATAIAKNAYQSVQNQ